MDVPTNQRVKRTQRDYTLAFKRTVVQEVEQGSLTYKQAQHKYGIQGRSTVLVWVRKLGSLDWQLPPRPPMKAKPAPPKPPTPEQRIKELEAALQIEKDRVSAYRTLIEVAEKEHGLSIRKKASPGQCSGSKKSGK
jgi:transposase